MNAAPALSSEDHSALTTAWQRLEHPSFAARLSSIAGTPLEQGLKLMPQSWYDRLHGALEGAIRQLLEMAIVSLDQKQDGQAHNDYHKTLCMASGAAGGFFGLPALVLELPVTTGIMLRSIADIAKAHGESLKDLDTRLACMEVFALGGRSREDDAADTGYYGVRGALALHFSTVKGHLVQTNAAVTANGTPAAIRLVSAIAARFGIPVSQKAAVQMVPLIGAATAALVNLAFMQHFQETASGHFTMRRLERKYGREVVRTAYHEIARVQE